VPAALAASFCGRSQQIAGPTENEAYISVRTYRGASPSATEVRMRAQEDRAMRLGTALLIGLITSVGSANPPTPAAHPEKDFRSIGSGLYLMRDQDLQPNDEGNIMLMVFSQHGISVDAPYSVDLFALDGVSTANVGVDGGPLGTLRMQNIEVDCRHRTYAAIDTRKALPDEIWRPASTAPALASVFQFVCSHAPKR